MKYIYYSFLLCLVHSAASFGQGVGINVANPNSPLSIRASPGSPSLIDLRLSDVAAWSLQLTGQVSSGVNFGIYNVLQQKERLTIKPDGRVGIGTTNPTTTLHVAGTVLADSGLNLNTQRGIQYQNGTQQINDWRLISRDDFETGTNDWIMTTLSSNQPVLGSFDRITGRFGNRILSNANGFSNQLLFKKTFDLRNFDASEMMVRFSYFFLDSWDSEYGVMGYFDSPTPTRFATVWFQMNNHNLLNDTPFDSELGYTNNGISDVMVSGTALFKISVTKMVTLAFGSTLNELPADESFGIDNVEVWIR